MDTAHHAGTSNTDPYPPSNTDPYPSRTGSQPSILDRHEPVVFAKNWADAPISEDQLTDYEKSGFAVLQDVFDESEVLLLQKELEELRSGNDDSVDQTRIYEPNDTALRSIFAIHLSNPLFSRLANDSRLIDIAEFILADDVYIHQSRLNYKPGFRGKEFYWHSDFETWHVEDGMPAMRALSISIALTENSANNGPLMVIPGSHKKFVTCSGQTPKNHFQESLRKQEYGVPCDDLLRNLSKERGIIAVDAPPGSVIVFDCNTMHGSNSNITPDPRSNAFFVYNAISNRVEKPRCNNPPRPEYICTRENVMPMRSIRGRLNGG